MTILSTFHPILLLLPHLQLVIHCGVNGKIDWINIETNARNGCFSMLDYNGKCLESPTVCLPNNGTCCPVLETQLDVERIVNELNLGPSGKVFNRSDDVGR